MTSAALLLRCLQRDAARVAYRFESRETTYDELDALSARYAASLAARGVGRGDRVATYCGTSLEAIVALVGHHRLGAVHVPINPRYRAEELSHILEDSGAKAIVVDATSECYDVLATTPRPPSVERVFALGNADPPPWGGESFQDLLDGPPARPPWPKDQDPALLIYTSGTTGKSKGVELSFGALHAAVSALTTLWRFSREDVLVHALPLFHVHGLCLGVHGALLHGMTTRLLPRFSPHDVVDAIEQGGTIFMGVPTMYARLLEHFAAHPGEGAKLARARLFTAGSAPLPAADLVAFEQATGHRILERYGMSETLITLSNPYEGARKPGSVGLPVPGYDVEILDDEGRPCPVGIDGEIAVRGAGVMTGYWNNPAATAASFKDGWFMTGDVAHRDEDGYVFIVGRKSTDVLKSGGYKISAREIEEALSKVPWIGEIAVFGVPDRTWGQRVVAAVVPRSLPVDEAREKSTELLEDLQVFAAKHLADYKRPRGLLVVEALPRNAMGKVQKQKLVELAVKDAV